MLLASFLLAQIGAKKMVAKALDLAKPKGIEKDILDCFALLAMTTVWIPAYAGMT
jgi:hypothetical protein